MTPARTYLLFKNDIALTIADTRRKMAIVHNDKQAEITAEVDHRLRSTWGMSLAQYNELSGN